MYNVHVTTQQEKIREKYTYIAGGIYVKPGGHEPRKDCPTA